MVILSEITEKNTLNRGSLHWTAKIRTVQHCTAISVIAELLLTLRSSPIKFTKFESHNYEFLMNRPLLHHPFLPFVKSDSINLEYLTDILSR